MARDAKLEVGGINIRIPGDHERDYTALISLLVELRRGVRVYGESWVALKYFDKESKTGIIAKYTEIDIDGDWFDLDDFDTAAPETVSSIVIPENLRPNLSQFYFMLDHDLHVVAFSLYAESKALSARSVDIYFQEALGWPEVRERFGRVESDIIKDYGAVEEILNLPDLKELHLIIRRPNTDDIGRTLAEVIEDRMKEQNGDEYEETLKAKGQNSLAPNERTRQLANVAAENGQVKAKSIVNGVLTEKNTSEKPLVEVETYKAESFEITLFQKLAEKIFGRVRAVREQANGQRHGAS